MRIRSLLSWLSAASLLLAPSLHAQDYEDYEEPASTRGIVIGAKGGALLTSPRQIFPSIRIGDSQQGNGEISSTLGEMGLGYRYGVELLIPFNEKLALGTEFGLQTFSARFKGDSTRLPTRLDVQAMVLGVALQGNLLVNSEAFQGTGLRNVYVGGGLEIGLQTLFNRIESFTYPDSSGVPQQASGSFQNNDPFRNLVGLRFAGGVRYGIDTHTELLAEAAYSFALNPVFSSNVVVDNSFTVDNLGVQVGIGYRF